MSVRTLLFKWVSITYFVCNVKIVWLISFTNNNCGVLRITFSKSLIVKVELNEKLVKEGMDQSHVSMYESWHLVFSFSHSSISLLSLFLYLILDNNTMRTNGHRCIYLDLDSHWMWIWIWKSSIWLNTNIYFFGAQNPICL